MWKLLPVFIFSLVLAWASEQNSSYYLGEWGEKVYIKKDGLFISIIAIMMSAFVGLRTNYNDTSAYVGGYQRISDSGSIFTDVDFFKIGNSPGFNLCQNILRHLGVPAQSFLMLFAFVTVCIYIWFIYKYTDNIWFSIFLFSTMGCYTFTMAAIRQCVAVAFCLIATDKAIQKKWIPFIIWILIAATFHPYSIMYLIVPLMSFKPWTKYTYWLLAICGAIGVGLQSLMGSILDITSMMGKEYSEASFSGEGVNIFRLAVVWVPVILSFMARKCINDEENTASNVIMNLSMVNAAIMFIALFGTANYFARLANYFLVFQTISLPWLFKYFNRGSKTLLTLGAVIGYLGYFYYANGIQFGGFDNVYKGIHLFDYIKIILGVG